jgi:hypothetical protein
MRTAPLLLLLLAAQAVSAQTFDPRPTSNSPLASGGAFTNARLAPAFFTPTTYRGAFAPGGERWDLPWANYSPQLTDYGSSTSGVTVVTGPITTNTTWTTGSKYKLSGFVNVNAGATLTIQPGVVIFGEQATKGSLIINRGALIDAQGTAASPIVFTSERAPGQRAGGDWGGVILAGRAALNIAGGEAVLEGGTNTTYGGGAAPNDNDDSGTLRYVRIEWAGIAFTTNNEINGLTLGAVGRATTIDYVQVAFSGDDAFEPFGGTVNLRHVVATAPVDDMFDGDNGWRGYVQFALGVSNPDLADISGSNGIEHDNDANGTTNTPLTQPVFSNLTILGPRTQRPTGTINPNFRRGAHLRRNAQTNLFNSVILGFTPGILIDGATSNAGAGSGALDIEGTLVSGSVTDNLGASSADTGAALAFFNGQPGNSALTSDAAAGIGSVVVAAESGPLAEAGFLLTVAPNPSVGSAARVTVSVPEATAARLSVYDVLGREVAVVADETLPSGEQTFALGQRLPAGVYVARLATARGTTAVQFTVVR